MTFQDLGSIGELVSAVAVVVSLLRFATFHRMMHQPGFKNLSEEGGSPYYARSFARRVEELLATPPDDSSAT
ncbi:MAG: hypothetical protein AMS21_11285 [Gemmatimonas sp. SG8_38_2]|jgi:hypothetical protein|nr:MAG: hypothetical protein AMS21_11285 [Gemmatimonas sp. SG8_38_2]